jgi:hypothetical protein
MAALKRSDYLILYYALASIQSGTLDSYISNQSFYSVPIRTITRNIEELLKRSNPKLSASSKPEDVPELKRLLTHLRGDREHSYFSKIEAGVKTGDWSDLPIDLGQDSSAKSLSKPVISEQATQSDKKDEVSEDVKKSDEEKKQNKFGGGRKPETKEEVEKKKVQSRIEAARKQYGQMQETLETKERIEAAKKTYGGMQEILYAKAATNQPQPTLSPADMAATASHSNRANQQAPPNTQSNSSPTLRRTPARDQGAAFQSYTTGFQQTRKRSSAQPIIGIQKPTPKAVSQRSQGRLFGLIPRISLGGSRMFLGKMASPLSKPTQDAASAGKVQLIRHPTWTKRLITGAMGGAAGTMLGGNAASGVLGMVLGVWIGPEIVSRVVNMGRPAQEQSDDSGEEQASSDGGGSGGSGNSSSGNSHPSINSKRRLARNLRNAANSARRLGAQATARVAPLLANPYFWAGIGIAILILIVILILMCVLPGGSCGAANPDGLKVTIEKTGDKEVANGADINYKINVVNKGDKTVDAIVTDKIPDKTKYKSGDNDQIPASTDPATIKEVKWTIKSLPANQSKALSLIVTPIENDIWVLNQANMTSNLSSASSSGSLSGGVSGSGLLPNPLPPPVSNWSTLKPQILEAVNKHPEVMAAYKKASELTGVPWEILAGLHYVETGSGPNPGASLVSGRKIGVVEPDVPRAACAAGVSGPGTPVPMGGGCGFTTFEDSAIYSAKHIISKINKVPQTFADAVAALSKYNGGGNTNCGEGTSYNFCPPDFPGEDDPYAMSFFSQKHTQMFLIFCGDGLRCPPKPFGRAGATAVMRALGESN